MSRVSSQPLPAPSSPPAPAPAKELPRLMRAVNLAVYGLVSALLYCARLVPMGFTFWWTRQLAHLAYRLFRGRRALLRYNLELALSQEYSIEERERIGRQSIEHLFWSLGELMHWERIHGRLSEHFKFEGAEIIERLVAAKQGFFLVGGHLGGWATMSLVFKFPELPAIHMVAKGMRNAKVQGLLEYLAGAHNIRIISGKGQGQVIEDRVQRGEIMQFWMDQEARRDQGTFVQFFGREASSFVVPGYLAWKNGVALVPYWVIRERPGHFRVEIREPLRYELTNDKQENNRRVTQVIIAEVERAVREHPEQWLWIHNRWRRRPDGTKVELFRKRRLRARTRSTSKART